VWVKDANGASVKVQWLSDGYRSVLSLILELLRQMRKCFGDADFFEAYDEKNKCIKLPGVVLVDEIDAHLHPSWQQRIGFDLTRAFPEVQFIVTSHSPIVCRTAVAPIARLDEPLSAPPEIRGTIHRLAFAENGSESRPLAEHEMARLVFGDILTAMSTGLFGENNPEAPLISRRMKERYAELRAKRDFGERLSMHEKAALRAFQIALAGETLPSETAPSNLRRERTPKSTQSNARRGKKP
jgi:hypothetical protein